MAFDDSDGVMALDGCRWLATTTSMKFGYFEALWWECWCRWCRGKRGVGLHVVGAVLAVWCLEFGVCMCLVTSCGMEVEMSFNCGQRTQGTENQANEGSKRASIFVVCCCRLGTIHHRNHPRCILVGESSCRTEVDVSCLLGLIFL